MEELDVPKEGRVVRAKPKKKRKGKISLTDRKYARTRTTSTKLAIAKDTTGDNEGCPSSTKRESDTDFAGNEFSSTGNSTVALAEKVHNNQQGKTLQKRARSDVSSRA